MTAIGERLLSADIRSTSRVNWRFVIDATIEVACVATATFVILYCWVSP